MFDNVFAGGDLAGAREPLFVDGRIRLVVGIGKEMEVEVVFVAG